MSDLLTLRVLVTEHGEAAMRVFEIARQEGVDIDVACDLMRGVGCDPELAAAVDNLLQSA